MGTWQRQLELMGLVAEAYPHTAGRAIVMCRRGKRGRGRLRPAMIVAMRVAAADALRMGERAPTAADGRRRLLPRDVYDMRIRALQLERDAALAAEYDVSQSSATRAIAGGHHHQVPFPITITHPSQPPASIFYPYQTAITILAHAPLDQTITITVQPSTPRLAIPGILRLLDQALPR
jgi:hypothetical protein